VALDASIIQNSPIGMQPKLSPAILTIMSTTTTQPTMTVQVATTTTAATTSGTATSGGTANPTPTQQITTAINKALHRNPGSGPGGPRAPGAPGGPAINLLAIVP